MDKNEQTSKSVASKASILLTDPKSSTSGLFSLISYPTGQEKPANTIL